MRGIASPVDDDALDLSLLAMSLHGVVVRKEILRIGMMAYLANLPKALTEHEAAKWYRRMVGEE